MMSKKLSKEKLQRIREEIKNGKSKYKVAQEMGIGKTTVYTYTIDIPGDNRGKPLSKEIIGRIREQVLKGKSKYKIAKDMNLSFTTVYSYTKDLPNKIYKTAGIQGKDIDLLHELLEHGYVNSNQGNCVRLRKLKRFLPMIQRAQIEGRSVYFLSDKSKEALQAIIKRNSSKIISYQKLAKMSKIFDINLNINEKNSFLGKTKPSLRRKMRKRKKSYQTFSKENQSQIDDFFGRFLHSEVLY